MELFGNEGMQDLFARIAYGSLKNAECLIYKATLKDFVFKYCSNIMANGNSNMAFEANEILSNTVK